MGLSLQEQLLKAGLVNQKQVKKAEHELRVQKKKGKKGQKGAQPNSNDAKERLKKQRAQQAEQDRQLNRNRLEQEQQKADLAAAQQLVQVNGEKLEQGDIAFHYVNGNGQIERLHVTQQVADQLASGTVGVAEHSGEYVLLPANTVAKVLQRAAQLIVAYNDPNEMDNDYPSEW